MKCQISNDKCLYEEMNSSGARTKKPFMDENCIDQLKEASFEWISALAMGKDGGKDCRKFEKTRF